MRVTRVECVSVHHNNTHYLSVRGVPTIPIRGRQKQLALTNRRNIFSYNIIIRLVLQNNRSDNVK